MHYKISKIAIALGLLAAAPAWAAPLAPGNLALYRVGDGSAAPSATLANALFIDEYTPMGTLVQSIALPTSGANALTSPSAKDIGLINRSANGRCLTLTGVAADLGVITAGLERAAAFLLPSGNLDSTVDGTSTLVKFGANTYINDSIRSSASADCEQVWVSGNRGSTDLRGIFTVAKDGSGLTQLFGANAVQGLTIANDQLYASIGGGSGTVSEVGTGLPTTGTVTNTSFTGGPAVNKNYRSVVLLDLDTGIAGVDTLYVTNNSDGRLEKYVGSGTAWTAAGSIAISEISGLSARNIGTPAEPVIALYFTDTATNSVRTLVDRAGRSGSLTGTPTTLIAAQPGQLLRGLAFTPENAPPTVQPDPATGASVTGLAGDGFTAQWNAPAAGEALAYYVVEVSDDDFASVLQTLHTPAGTPSATITGLSVSTAYKFRVRAINSAGGSSDLLSDAITTLATSNAAPTLTGLTHNAPYTITAGDSNEPLASIGLNFSVADGEDAAGALAVSVTSANLGVLPAANLSLSDAGDGSWNLKIATADLTTAGYADVALSVTDSANATTTTVLKLAVSVRGAADLAGNTNPRWIGGRSDVSDGLPIGSQYVLASDDEPKNVINLYARQQSGQPLKTFDISAELGVNAGDDCAGIAGSKCDGETDIEASTRIADRAYWLGSHSNNKNGKIRPDRWRIFAYDLAGSDLDTTLTLAGYYQHLRSDLLAWDHGNGHTLGADYLGFTASTALNVAPESATLDGFSFEGVTSSPDDGQLWLAMRAPLVSAPLQPAVTSASAAGRTHALIIQVNNYADLLQPDGGTAGSASIGTPIRLDLGGRAIRDIRKNAAGQYLLIAGPPASATGSAPNDFRLYTWDGSYDANGLASNVQLRAGSLASFTQPNYGGSAEGIIDLPVNLTATSQIDIITDSGDVVFYNDGIIAKDLGDNGPSSASANVALKKTRIDTVTLGAAVSSNAALTALTSSAGMPLFDSVSSSYSLSVAYNVESLTLTPTAADAGATIRVDGNVVASANQSLPLALALGSNILPVTVTATDGSTLRSYSLTVTRGANVAPGAPTNVTVQPGATQATVYFTAPGANGGSAITGYRVTALPAVGQPIIVTGAGSPITVTGLDPSTSYTFSVLALNAVGPSAPSANAVPQANGVQGVPTLSQWSMILLGLMLAGVARLRQRRLG